MQVVEDVEEGFLCLLALGGHLYVVDYQHVDHLIEVHEIVDAFFFACVAILVHELLAGDVEHCLVGVQFFGLEAYGIGQVCLAKPHATVDEQRVERGGAGLLGHGIAGRTCQTVAFALDKVVKGVTAVELRRHTHLAQAGDDEGVGYLAHTILVDVHRHRGQRVGRGLATLRRERHHTRLGGDGLVHHYAVLEHGARPKLRFDDSA